MATTSSTTSSSAAITPTLQQALSALAALSVPWFDDNPYAWEGGEIFAGPITLWDQVCISGFWFLGEVSGQIGTKLDNKTGVDSNVTLLTSTGQLDTPIDVKLWLPTPTDLFQFALMLQIAFKPTNARQPVEISHPSLAIFNLGTGPWNAFYLSEVSTIVRPSGGQPASVSLKFFPFKALQPSAVSAQGTPSAALPSSSSQSASTGTPPSPPSPPALPSSGITPPSPS